MELTEGDFSCFSLEGQLWMLDELGTFLFQKETADMVISVYELYSFYVEMIYDKKKREVVKIFPITNNMFDFYFENL